MSRDTTPPEDLCAMFVWAVVHAAAEHIAASVSATIADSTPHVNEGNRAQRQAKGYLLRLLRVAQPTLFAVDGEHSAPARETGKESER